MAEAQTYNKATDTEMDREAYEVAAVLRGLPTKDKLIHPLAEKDFNQAATARSLGITSSAMKTLIRNYFPSDTLPTYHHYRAYKNAVYNQRHYAERTDIEVPR